MNKLILVLALVLGSTAAAQTPAPDPELQKRCAEQMNADATFEQGVLTTFDKKLDQKTIDTNLMNAAKIQRDNKHVFLAYGAMWVIAALFLVFLWWRQTALTREIGVLRRELDAAAKDDKK